MEERKKRIYTEESKRKKKDTVRLVNVLCEQAGLDEKLRNVKLWLRFCKSEKKMQKLKGLLEVEGLMYSLKQVEEEFAVHEKEDNPFFSVSSHDYNLETAAAAYARSEKHWRRNILRKFNRRALEEEELNSHSLDLDKKGYLVLEDLVRFLNMETGTFFRNRDLVPIFRRLCGNEQKLTFSDLLNTLCG
jgi:hypothetical protein